MEIAQYVPATMLTENRTQIAIKRIAKRISKMIIKQIFKSLKENSYLLSSLYVKHEIFKFPLDFNYDGTYIQCFFFKNSLFTEIVDIYPDDLNDLFISICLNIEEILSSISNFNVRNINFEILPGTDPTKKSIILFSYKWVM